MAAHHIIPAQEIEVIVAKKDSNSGGVTTGQVRLRVNGRHEWKTSEVQINYQELRQQYEKLEGLATQPPPGKTLRMKTLQDYESKRDALGDALGHALIPSDSPLQQALRDALQDRRDGEYIRVVLCFEEPELLDLPWELLRWRREGADEPIWLGRDERFALSRLAAKAPVYERRALHCDRPPLSVLNVVAGRDLEDEQEISRNWLEKVEDYLPMLHAVSRKAHELDELRHTMSLFGQEPRFQIIQWMSHGGDTLVSSKEAGKNPEVSVDAIIKQVGDMGFVWLVLACYSAGNRLRDPYGSPSRGLPLVHQALVAKGVPAVIGAYGYLEKETVEEKYMAALYASLIRGWPLDFAVQKLRAILYDIDEFAKSRRAPHRWSKPVLLVGSTWYLGGAECHNPDHAIHEPVTVNGWLARWMRMDRVLLEPGAEPVTEPVTVDRQRLERLEKELNYLGPIALGPDPVASQIFKDLKEEFARLTNDDPKQESIQVPWEMIDRYHKLIERLWVLQLAPNPL